MLRRNEETGTRGVSVELPIALWKAMKMESLERDRTMKALLLEALELVYGPRVDNETKR
jgi:hypothetical protein